MSADCQPSGDSSFRERFTASMLPLDPALSRLLAAAAGPVGLALLLLFGRDPRTFDTAAGFAARLQYPTTDVQAALVSLREGGIVRACIHPGEARERVTYWLPEDATLQATLGRLDRLYRSGAAERYGILCTLAAGS